MTMANNLDNLPVVKQEAELIIEESDPDEPEFDVLVVKKEEDVDVKECYHSACRQYGPTCTGIKLQSNVSPIHIKTEKEGIEHSLPTTPPWESTERIILRSRAVNSCHANDKLVLRPVVLVRRISRLEIENHVKGRREVNAKSSSGYIDTKNRKEVTTRPGNSCVYTSEMIEEHSPASSISSVDLAGRNSPVSLVASDRNTTGRSRSPSSSSSYSSSSSDTWKSISDSEQRPVADSPTTQNSDGVESIRKHTDGRVPEKEELSEMKTNQGQMSKIKMTKGKSKSLYVCHLCDKSKSFSRKVSFNIHLRIHADRELKQAGHYDQPNNLRTATKLANETDHLYPCCVCKTRFRTRCEIRVHISAHISRESTTCMLCKKPWPRQMSHKAHLLDHMGFVLHTCHDCGKSFCGKSALVEHMRIHTVDKPFECSECPMTFFLRKYRDQHAMSHKPVTEWPFSCQVCGKRFTSEASVRSHMSTHKTERFQCDECERSYSMKISLTRHKLHNHNQNTPKFPCPKCEKRFHTRYALRVHEKYHEGRTFKCDQCPKTYLTLKHLTGHKLSHRRPEVQCEVCNKYIKFNSLYCHMTLHTDRPRVFACHLCEKKFAKKCGFQSHLRTHLTNGERPFPCTRCEKRFNTLLILRHHLEKHGEEARKPFQCVKCGKGFARKKNLTRHVATMHGLREYACDKCPNVYDIKYLLDRHKWTHVGVKPFECDYCKSTFASKGVVKYHINRQHIAALCGSVS